MKPTKYLYGDTEIDAGTLPPAISVRTLPNGDLELSDASRVFTVAVARGERGALWLSWQGRSFALTPAQGHTRKAAQKSGSLSAPMTGVVAEVLVELGQEVQAYQPLVTVEAMKVLATLEAPFAGTVTAIYFSKALASNTVLCSLNSQKKRKNSSKVP